MNLHLQKGFITHAPTECLIEDYQMLANAYQTGDWSLVRCAMECISNTISNYTTSPDEKLKIIPSPSSVINMAIGNGILMDGTEDIKCKAGKPVSEALSCSGFCACPVDCPHYQNGCDPERNDILLQGNIHYYMDSLADESIIEQLKKQE